MPQKLLLSAFSENTNEIPVWFLRQAGRYLPEYRKLKEKAGGFLKMCTQPEYAAEVSLQPLERFDLDGVILFSDILTPLIPMGIQLDFVPHPVIANPIQNIRDIENLKLQEPSECLKYVGEALQIIRQKMPKQKTLIGFGGAPFTLASYLFKTEKSQDFSAIKKFCFSNEQDYQLLMQKLTESCYQYLSYQIQSGAEVIQIFDSWAGCFHQRDYKKYVLKFVKQLVSKLQSNFNTPIIYYLNGGSHLIDALLEIGADGLSLDWKTSASEIREKNAKIVLQGNLDPFHFFSSEKILQQELEKIARDFGDSPWIFNIGQGLDKTTPIEKVQFAISQLRKIKKTDYV
jgi:uroporphyrinogen decarboxylase